ncbi:unnamed protein product [Rangifer tarandus platyrhynchus]|uniref:Uncharacterized protein n=1 Tax=Rangifer tarandus platyrhynchus TaxID=3082113 RepID=A0AC59YZF0_RANTA
MATGGRAARAAGRAATGTCPRQAAGPDWAVRPGPGRTAPTTLQGFSDTQGIPPGTFQMVLAMLSDFYVTVWLLGELEVNSKQHFKASVSGAELEQEMRIGE